MSPTLEVASDLDIERVEDWFSSDSHRILFTVTQDGSPRDISNDDLSWALYEDPYDFGSQTPIIDDSDAGVEIVTDPEVDPTSGEFEVRVDEGTLSGEWGEYWERPVVDPTGDTRQSWRGEVWLESA